MGRRSSDEFPLLPAYGLYAAPIEGNGNCLFNALSDQIYGDQSRHGEIRSRVIEYMRENGEYFKQFIEVNPGGGVRRNPKRKNAGAFSTPINTVAPTAEEIDNSFEKHITRMAQGGTYGDNLEIQAFSTAYGVDVKIYQRDFALMVSGSYEEQPNGRAKPVAHIAYHDYEHFSSVRNLDGPHAGLPKVKETFGSAEAELSAKESQAKTSFVAPWMVELVKNSLPFHTTDLGTIHRALVRSNGDVDAATSELLENEERGSVSSTQGSSSVERDQDSDDESVCGPKKKRDRRLSRAARANAQYNHELTYRPKEVKPEATSSAQDTKIEEATGLKDNVPEKAPANNGPQALESSPAPHSGARLKLTQPRRRKEDYDPDWSESPRARSISHTRGQRAMTRGGGAKGKLISARDRKDMKKAAQKAAAKERKQGLVAVDQPISKGGTVSLSSKKLERSSPTIGITTLYI